MERIYPKILNEKSDGGKFILRSKMNIYFCQEAEFASALYGKLLNQFTVGLCAFNVVIDKTMPKYTITINEKDLAKGHALKAGLKYQINVTKSGVVISGESFTGLANAFMSLLQLIKIDGIKQAETAYIPTGKYEDKPKVNFRGVHFCLFPGVSLDFLKDFIRLSAMYRYSHFIVEFWGTLKYDTLGVLGWQDAYDKEEIRAILQEARMLGLEVIPFFNHMGHASQSRSGRGEHVVLNQRPELEVLFEPDGWTWCLSNPESIRILKSVREELIELCGEGEYFHIGIDEAYSFASCPHCRVKDKENLFVSHLNSISAELKAVGRKCIIWGDMLLPDKDFSQPYIASPDKRGVLDAKRIVASLDSDIIIADWQYNIRRGHDKTAKYWQDNKKAFIMCPWYDENNIITCSEIAKDFGVGLLLTTWNETQPFIYGLLLGAEHAWNGNEDNAVVLRSVTAALLRKLSPNTDREKAGFKGINHTINMLMEMH